jgi:hypothetical protein
MLAIIYYTLGISTKPGSAAAQQQPQQPGEGSPVVPKHQPGGSPAPVSAKPGLAAAQHQPGEGNLAASTPKSWKLIQKSTKNFQKGRNIRDKKSEHSDKF